MMSPMGCIGLRHDITMLKSPKDRKGEDGSSGSGKDKAAKDIPVWVQPKERFMKLLKSVGAEGPWFTAQEVMSLLIKYISSRRLFDQEDPKTVYCNNDPLGEVFGVSMFTIQDARRLLFENLIVLQIPGQQSCSTDHNSSCYFTFSHHSIPKQNMQDVHSGEVLGARAIKSKDSLDGVSGVSKPCVAGTSRIPSRLIKHGESSKRVTKRHLSSSSSAPSSVTKQKTRRRKRMKSKVKIPKEGETCESKTPEKQTSSNRKIAGRRPWYYIVYTSSEDIQSKSSEVLSVQDNETIEAHNSSDDLWFLEDEFALEFEVVSTSSDTCSVEQTGDEQSLGSEIVLDVKLVDSSESRQGDYSSTVDSDEEISEADKWRCTECTTKNSPLSRYCVRCMAVRSGWLPDDQRMTLWERLHHQGYPSKRTMSAPASNKPLPPSCTNQSKTFDTSPRQTSQTSLTVTGGPVDVSDGRTNKTGPGKAPPDSPPSGPQHLPRPQQLVISSQSDPLERIWDLCPLPPPPPSPSPPPQGVDEGGCSIDSPKHGPGSQTTLSPPLEDTNTAQSPLKRPWSTSKTREDSGLGVSLEAFSSQDTNTLSSSHQPLISQDTSQGHTTKRLKTYHQSTHHAQHTSHRSSSAQGSHHGTNQQQQQPPCPAGPSSSSTAVKSTPPDVCTFCCSRPKNAVLVHGKSGHQVCCYQCAMKLQKRGKPCPACRKPIERIIRNYYI